MFGLFITQVDKIKIDEKFNKFCVETYDDLRVKIYAKTRDKYMTDEIVQETYKIASENKEKLLSHPQPEGWLYKAAVNIYNNNIRKNIKMINNETELTEELIAEFAADDKSIEIAEEILSTLSKKDRTLLEMQFYDDLSLNDISRKTNINYDALQKYNRRLIQEIKKIFLEK